MSRINFFEIAAQFPAAFETISRFGSLWIELHMTEDQMNQINSKYSNAISKMAN